MLPNLQGEPFVAKELMEQENHSDYSRRIMKHDIIENIDALEGINALPDHSVDLLIADPPYGLGKDYGNDSDKKPKKEFLLWMEKWLTLTIPKLKNTGSLYIFTTWRYSPEIFVFLKQHLIMLNEIIWDRRVPSMGGTTRKYSSVHDTIGFFAKTDKYYFDLDPIRVPYDADKIRFSISVLSA